jgi:hypothetical protein
MNLMALVLQASIASIPTLLLVEDVPYFYPLLGGNAFILKGPAQLVAAKGLNKSET